MLWEKAEWRIALGDKEGKVWSTDILKGKVSIFWIETTCNEIAPKQALEQNIKNNFKRASHFRIIIF